MEVEEGMERAAKPSSPIPTKELRVSLPRLASAKVRSLSESSSGSADTMVEVDSRPPSPNRLWQRKRGASSVSEDDPGSADSRAVVEAARVKRKRGRPPTTGEFVGYAKAKAELNAAKERELELRAEEELAEDLRRRREKYLLESSAPKSSTSTSAAADVAAQSLRGEELSTAVDAAVETILTIAKKSSKLKGQYVRALRDAANSISENVRELRARTETEEVVRLEIELSAMRAELDLLKQQASAATPSFSREEIAFMIDSRFEGIQDRLLPEPRLRPPLQADKRRAAAASSAVAEESIPDASPEPLVPRVVAPSKVAPVVAEPVASASGQAPTAAKAVQPSESVQPPKNKRRRKKKSAAAREAQATREARPLPPAPASLTQAWNTVAGKKAPAKQASAAATAAASGAKIPKLRPPRTAAVVLTLQPDAMAKGATYAGVLEKAEKSVDLKSLGIEGVRFRTAATGARILEVAGTGGGEKADALASSLRVALGDDVRVSRPEKFAELRISGLDDAATVEKVASAIAAEGGCSVDALKVGDIKRPPGRQATVFVRCPIAAAKRVTDGRRILVGWSAVRPTLLEPRPARCFRCLVPGHIGVKCTASVDRSAVCFNCCQPGHRAAACTAEPHCSACDGGGKASGHRLGSKECPARSQSRTQGRKAASDGPRALSQPASTARSEEVMDTTPI